MAKKEAFLQFLKAARSLADQGLSKEAIVQFAKNEFGEISELFQKQIDSLFKPKKGIENIKIKDEVFDDTVVKMQFDDAGVPFNPKDPLKTKTLSYEEAVAREKAKAAADEDYIMKIFDPEDFAKGGRAGHYTGGIVDVEPSLSDIGHGSDALMARTRLISPNNQATTSTGLNYLLAEDNDNLRVPFKEKGKVSLLDLIKVNASGSKSGRQQIQGAPKGITVDKETINAIVNLDIPINEKMNLIGSYAYGKGRNKIEDKEQEIFLDEGGYKDRNIGLGFNQDGEGLSGSIMRNLETGDDNFKIEFLKRFAEGGRIGFSKGKIAKEVLDKGRRGFMKAAGATGAGIAALKTGLLGLGEKAAPVVEKVAETVSNTAGQVPPYFLNLVNKIRKLGEDTLASQDKTIAKKYKDYVMEEDFAGNITIVKSGDDIEGNKIEDVYMSYKVDDVALKDKDGFAKVEDYEEFTARPDAEGKMKDVEPGVPEEVIEEGTIFEDTLSEFGKASGGIARMIGE